jgi:Cys-tRNA(Pro)/Cys-tRNA(Cys) deacylase
MGDKTLAMLVLEGKKSSYQVFEYPDTERDAVKVADAIGAPAGQVFKTLVVVQPSSRPMLVMLPANRELALKKLAKVVGAKKVKMATHRETEALTGMKVGGISALALINRGFAIYLDRSARDCDEIYVSSGRRGLNIKLSVDDLIRITRARVVDVAESTLDRP